MKVPIALLIALAFPAGAAHTARLDDLAGIIVVPTIVNGRGPFHFVLDTGAGAMVVTPQLAKTLGLRPGGTNTATGMGAKTVTVQDVELNSVSVAGATQPNVRAVVIPLPPGLTYQGSYGTIDGIVGYTFLRHYAVTLDVAGGRATLTPSANFTAPAGIRAIPFTYAERGIPAIRASVEGATGRFEVDSGNNGDVILTREFAQRHGVARRYANRRIAEYQGVGGRVTAQRVRLERMTVDANTMHSVAATISDSSLLKHDRLDGNIGYGILRQVVITLDYPRARAYFQPGRRFDAYAATLGTGLVCDRTADGRFEVLRVLPQTPAARSGVKSGDVIVAINGRKSEALSNAGYAAQVGRPSVRYTLLRAGVQRTVTVRSVDLLPPVTR